LRAWAFLVVPNLVKRQFQTGHCVGHDLLLPELLAPLVRNTIFSRNIYHWAEVESTNVLAAQSVAAARAADTLPEGEVFLAEEQTAGRGRGNHSWYSERGTGIYCSVVLRPSIKAEDVLWLSLISAVAAQDAIREVTGAASDIRWPNDLLLNDKKFCGILTEVSTESDRVNHAIVGIGINVNHEQFPDDLSKLATSLRLETGKQWSRLELTAALLKSLDREYRALVRAVHSPVPSSALRYEMILKRVEARSSYAYGKLVQVDENGGYSGVTDGLDARGFLRIRTKDGLRMAISGSVRPLARRTDAAGD
jgi:BirA family transcriptional regulator, biotin operon repressor / biotin---[acetyl-CoA-carboxylase] ligase